MTKLTVHFTKMHGLGNDFVVLDLICSTSRNKPSTVAPSSTSVTYHHGNEGNCRFQCARFALSKFLRQHYASNPLDWEFPCGFVRRLCHRQLGVGCDQLVVLCDGGNIGELRRFAQGATDLKATSHHTQIMASIVKRSEDFSLNDDALWVAARLYNGSEGSEVGMCANALRCIAFYYYVFVAIRDNRIPSSTVFVSYPFSGKAVKCEVEVDLEVLGAMLANETVVDAPLGECPHVQCGNFAHMVLVLEESAVVVVHMGQPVVDPQDVPAQPPQSHTSLPSTFDGCAFPISKRHAKLYLDQRCENELEKKQLARLMSLVDGIFAVGMGNPHCVVLFNAWGGDEGSARRMHLTATQAENKHEYLVSYLVDNESTPELRGSASSSFITDHIVDRFGFLLSDWLAVFPGFANVEFLWLNAIERSNDGSFRTQSRMKVYERGAGRTLACGSGACSCGVVLAALCDVGYQAANSPTFTVTSSVEMDGGELKIAVTTTRSDETTATRRAVVMEGSASVTMTGQWMPSVD